MERMEEYRDVSSEIKLVRVALDRAFLQMTAVTNIDQTVALLNAITRGAACLGHLTRIQKLIFGDEHQSVDQFLRRTFGEVLDEAEHQRAQLLADGYGQSKFP